MTRRKVTELDVPLFENLPAAKGSPREQPRPTRCYQFGPCPHHTSRKLTGLVRSGRHLYWKPHYVRTYGSSRLCTASDAPLCSAPVKRGGPLCPCGGHGETHSRAVDPTTTD